MSIQVTFVTVNDERLPLDADHNVRDLLARLKINPRHVAVELDGQVVAFDQFDKVVLRGGERIEVVTLMGGG